MRMASLAILAICATGAHAQTHEQVSVKSTSVPQLGLDIATVQERRDLLFRRMLEKPDDLDAAFEYAALSIQTGDLEAAISTLERMLVFAPGLPRLQLELGVLYYRLNAYETARSYFEAAVSGPDVPVEVQAKVQQYLASIDTAGLATRVAGQIRAGLRYQTNANRAPLDASVTLNGLPFTLDPGSLGDEDWNVYGAGIFHVSHKLPGQGNTLEADLIVYGSKQFEREELDLALAEVTIGPAFNLARFGVQNGALGIYGIASGIFLDDEFYSGGVGLGTRLVLRPSPRFSSISAVEYRYRDYHKSDAAKSADDRDGSEFRIYTNATYLLAPTIALRADAYLQRTDARRGYYSYWETGIAASASYSFAGPFGSRLEPWIVSPTAGVLHREFDDPDPLVNAVETEVDWEAFVGGSLLVPIASEWALLAEAEYRRSHSNYDLRDYSNFSVGFSIVKEF